MAHGDEKAKRWWLVIGVPVALIVVCFYLAGKVSAEARQVLVAAIISAALFVCLQLFFGWVVYLRPRFSVRTLAIFVTLVCAYFGAWEATLRYAATNPECRSRHAIRSTSSPLPLVVRRELRFIVGTYRHQEYHLWLFGPEIELNGDSLFMIGTLLVGVGYVVLERLKRPPREKD